MSLEALRLLERAHAILAWIATIALLFSAVVALRKGPSARGLLGASALGGALLLGTGALGLLLDEGYRSRLRQRLFLASPDLGWLFERKLHLAFGAMLLAVAGLASLVALRRAAPSGDRATALTRAVKLALGASALLALFASIASALVARRAIF